MVGAQRFSNIVSHPRFEGPVISFRSGKSFFVILNNAAAIHDLLQTRSKLYSDRPSSVMLQLVQQDRIFTRLSSQDPHFPIYRRMAQEEMGTRGISRLLPILDENIPTLLKNLLSDDENFSTHLRNCQSSSIMKAIYGYSVKSGDDHFIKIVERWWLVVNAYLRPGIWLVDSYPILKFLPRWMPGAGFWKFASATRTQTNEALSSAFIWAQAEIKGGKASPSFVSRQLARHVDSSPEYTEIIKQVTGTMYVAGVDTVLSAMRTFVLMMVLNPDVQRRGQEEIDRVIGSDRLPLTSDRGDLPYIDALAKEVLRFHPPGPLGLAHSVTEDDIYNGMLIPKGSIVVPNIWAVTHDKTLYPNPMKFDPLRYFNVQLEKKQLQPDPRNYVYGFGRRVCGGMLFADAAVFTQIAAILSIFTISKEIDQFGKEITPIVDFTGGIVTHPEDFVCKFTARSREAVELVTAAMENRQG
ncbi:cytochrome P450 [Sistotremastrum niveocremeum HHB9708]|uniref:Cytochrome P450 n=1 Tax=Sistotremastrum niveocremeum HHB9708 TaxID=1314777 RepID=A0A164NDY9_9AGAM|nr:cytochrome P450 [Sistotremastrum niveocremeum HHB9708]